MKAVSVAIAIWFALFAVDATMAQLASKGASMDGKAQYASLFGTAASLGSSCPTLDVMGDSRAGLAVKTWTSSPLCPRRCLEGRLPPI